MPDPRPQATQSDATGVKRRAKDMQPSEAALDHLTLATQARAVGDAGVPVGWLTADEIYG